MRKSTSKVFKLLCMTMIFFVSCEKEPIEVIKKDFSVVSEVTNGANLQKQFINQPVEFNFYSPDFDKKNKANVKTFFRIIEGKGKIIVNNDTIKTSDFILYDYKSHSKSDFDFKYVPHIEGQHTIVIEAVSDVVERTDTFRVFVIKPNWSIDLPKYKPNEFIPSNKDFEFIIGIIDKDTLEGNAYFMKYHFLDSVKGTLVIDGNSISENEFVSIEKGGNISVINVDKEGDVFVEIIVVDKYGVENIDTLLFHSKTMISPISVNVDKEIQTVSIGEKASIMLDISEQDYQKTFHLEYHLISGKGVFEGEKTQGLLTGKHLFTFTPQTFGPHVFAVKIIDEHGQAEEKEITVNGVYDPLLISLNSSEVFIDFGQSTDITLIVSEKNYSGKYFVEYLLPDFKGGFISINNNVVNERVKTEIPAGNNHLKFTSSFVGPTQVKIMVTDERGQSKEAIITVNVKCLITTLTQSGGSVSDGGSYVVGTKVTVKAAPESNYQLEGWYENGDKKSDDPNYTFTVSNNRVLEARFSLKQFLISADITGNGTVTGNGKYPYGSSPTLRAAPANNYEFGGWYENGTQISTKLEYKIPFVVQSRQLEARFIITKHELTLENTTGGIISPSSTSGGRYDYNTQVFLNAVPQANYIFKGWYDGFGNLVSSSKAYSFFLKEDTHLKPVFVTSAKKAPVK